MFAAQPKSPADHGNAGRLIAWYAWEDIRKDDSWLVSYVDLLIILLAATVVLIGQMAPRTQHTGTRLETSIADAPTSNAPDMISSARVEPEMPTIEPPAIPKRGTRFAELVKQRFQGEIRAAQVDQGVTLVISDAVLFDSARATLRDSASSMLIRLADTLEETGDALVAVEGHTDDRPLNSGYFRSNWELAAARAHAVTRFLIAQGLDANRLRAVSYADTRPTADNSTWEGRAANRRVELRVEFLPDLKAVNAGRDYRTTDLSESSFSL